MSKIIIVDDHPLIVRGVRFLLEKNGHEILDVQTTGFGAIEAVLYLKPELIIMDLCLPDCNGLEVIEAMRATRVRAGIIVLTGYADSYYKKRCLEMNVSEYVLKTDVTSQLLQAVSREANSCRASLSAAPKLSIKERTVLQGLAEGKSNKSLSESMQISEKTVSTYKTRALRKLNARSLIEAVRIAAYKKIITG